MSSHTSKKNKLGFALIEVLVAVTIISTAMIFVVAWTNKTLIFARTTLTNYQVALAIEESVEAMKAMRAASWSNIGNLSNGVTYGISFSGTNWTTTQNPTVTANGFTQSITAYDVYRDTNDDIAESGTLDTGTKRILVTVTWQDRETMKTQSLEMYLADIL